MSGMRKKKKKEKKKKKKKKNGESTGTGGEMRTRRSVKKVERQKARGVGVGSLPLIYLVQMNWGLSKIGMCLFVSFVSHN